MTEHIPVETEDQLINGTGCECAKCKPQGVILVAAESQVSSTLQAELDNERACVVFWQKRYTAAEAELEAFRKLHDLVTDFRPVFEGGGHVAKSIREQLAVIAARDK